MIYAKTNNQFDLYSLTRSLFSHSKTKVARYEALIDDYYNDLFRCASLLTIDKKQAELILERTFDKVRNFLSKEKYDHKVLSQLIFTFCIELARMKHTMRLSRDGVAENNDREMDAMFSLILKSSNKVEEKRDEVALIHHAYRSLDEKYRFPLALQIISDFSPKEIARVLNLSEEKVLARLKFARKFMQDSVGFNSDLYYEQILLSQCA